MIDASRARIFYLYCEACKVRFQPIVCTDIGELLRPDYEQVEREGFSHTFVEDLRLFHSNHLGHTLLEKSSVEYSESAA